MNLDSAQLRVLAHPLRSRLLSALRAFGPATATELAQRLHTNSGATSYHLRQLADVGLIEEQPEGTGGRRRCRQAAHDGTCHRESAFEGDADDRAAVDWLAGHHIRLVQRWTDDRLESRREWSTQWRDAAEQSDDEFAMTPQGLAALNRDLHAVVERYGSQADPAAPGAEKCAIVLQSSPCPHRDCDPDRRDGAGRTRSAPALPAAARSALAADRSAHPGARPPPARSAASLLGRSAWSRRRRARS